MECRNGTVTFGYTICDVLHDLVPFVQFQNMKNTHGRVLLLVKLPATLLKVTLHYGVFPIFKIVQMVKNCAKDHM